MPSLQKQSRATIITLFKPALCSVTFRKLSPKAIIDLSKAAELSAIEWATDAHVPVGDKRAANEIADLCRHAGITSSYGSYLAPPSDDLAEFVRGLETAITCGATNIRIWPGTRQRDSKDYSTEERLATIELIRNMGSQAAKFGLTVSLEYHTRSLTDTTDSARRLIEAINHENVYLYWQPRPGLPLDDALAEIATIGEHISHVHVFAWDGDRNRFPLSTAHAYWQSIFAALPSSRWKHQRYAMLEFVVNDDPKCLLDDAAILKKILDNR